MITNVLSSRYNFSKLITDVDNLVLEKMEMERHGTRHGTLFFTMVADVETSFDQIMVNSDASVREMFERNMVGKEVELNLMTDDVEPLEVIIHVGKRKIMRKKC